MKPEDVPDEWVEMAAKAAFERSYGATWEGSQLKDEWRLDARHALAAVLPLAVAEERGKRESEHEQASAYIASLRDEIAELKQRHADHVTFLRAQNEHLIKRLADIGATTLVPQIVSAAAIRSRGEPR